MWIAPEVKDPVLTHAPTRKSIACFGAVSLETGKFAYSLCNTFDAKTFETFLMLLLRRRSHPKRMVIVLDNARYHHAKLLAPLLHKYRKVLRRRAEQRGSAPWHYVLLAENVLIEWQAKGARLAELLDYARLRPLADASLQSQLELR